jgi:hypothetical protein
MTTKKNSGEKLLLFVLAGLVVLLCAACGSKQTRGEPPLVRLNELSHQDNSLSLQLSIRNINDFPMEVLEIDFTMLVNDNDFIVHNGPVNINVGANSTENWTLEAAESSSNHDHLNQLENDEIKSLPYVMKGSIKSLKDSNLRFEYEGHIYPLPGRPGYFR